MAPSPRPPSTPTTAPTISHPAHTLLSRAHSPDTAADIFTAKVKNRPLLLQPTAHSDKRALRRHVHLRKKEYYLRKRKPRPLSAKEKRELGAFELKKEEIRYDIYRGLHEMWNQYMLEVLGYMKDGRLVGSSTSAQHHQQQQQQQREKTVSAQSHGSLLASADFHGAEVEVVRSKDVGKVGMKGIVVRDTKFTFVVVTPKDEVKTLPKNNSVFRYVVEIPGLDAEGPQDENQDRPGGTQSRKLAFEVHGSQFEFRPAERANRKFKWRFMDYL